MTKWQEVKLGDVCSIIDGDRGKNYPKESEFTKSGYCLFLNTKNVPNTKFDFSECSFISKEKDESLRKGKVKYGDIVVTTRGTLANFAYYTEKCKYKNIRINSGMVILRNEKQNFDTSYLYHFLMSNSFKQQVISYATGSAQPQLPIKDMKNITIPLPPLTTQKQIAGVLSALDDKIELNNKINQNLEHQAQALFDKMIMKHNNRGCIGDYCSVKSGFAFKSSWWQGTGVKVIKIKNIETSELNLKDCSFVSKENAELARDFFVNGGDLLIAMTGATIGKFAIVPKIQDMLVVNQRVGKFFLGSNPVQRLPFIYCTLKQQDVFSEIVNRGQGSAQPNISGNDIMSISCVYPDEDIISDYNSICQPYFEKIITNQQENTRLAQLRDTLLPKLMSGEIDVSQVDISKEIADNKK